jgi:hypothetical protein
MKIKLEATGTIEPINGIPARLWTGFTESGVPIKAWVSLLEPQTHDPAMLEDFDNELKSVQADRQLAYFDIRLAT